MKIPVCDSCKKKNVEGTLCRHCDNFYCYDCLDLNKANLRLCSTCGEFICEECYEGMMQCDYQRRR